MKLVSNICRNRVKKIENKAKIYSVDLVQSVFNNPTLRCLKDVESIFFLWRFSKHTCIL